MCMSREWLQAVVPCAYCRYSAKTWYLCQWPVGGGFEYSWALATSRRKLQVHDKVHHRCQWCRKYMPPLKRSWQADLFQHSVACAHNPAVIMRKARNRASLEFLAIGAGLPDDILRALAENVERNGLDAT